MASRFAAEARNAAPDTMVVPPIVMREIILGDVGEMVAPCCQGGARDQVGLFARDVCRRRAWEVGEASPNAACSLARVARACGVDVRQPPAPEEVFGTSDHPVELVACRPEGQLCVRRRGSSASAESCVPTEQGVQALVGPPVRLGWLGRARTGQASFRSRPQRGDQSGGEDIQSGAACPL